jgi:hypothetical protein
MTADLGAFERCGSRGANMIAVAWEGLGRVEGTGHAQHLLATLQDQGAGWVIMEASGETKRGAGLGGNGSVFPAVKEPISATRLLTATTRPTRHSCLSFTAAWRNQVSYLACCLHPGVYPVRYVTLIQGTPVPDEYETERLENAFQARTTSITFPVCRVCKEIKSILHL